MISRRFLFFLFLICEICEFCVGHEHHDAHPQSAFEHTDAKHRRAKEGGSARLTRTTCGTRDPTPVDFRSAEEAVRKYRADPERRTDIVVPVCFHVLSSSTVSGPSDAKLQAQMDALNEGFSSNSCCDDSLYWCDTSTCSIETGISFEFARYESEEADPDTTVGTSVTTPNACVVRTENEDFLNWSSFEEDCKMKRSLRLGDYSTLNVYFVSFGDNNLLGYATLPSAADRFNDQDGIVNCFNCLPGDSPPYNEGDTLVHEVGHWMSLFHTFQGGCRGGDEVDDTPAERSPNYQCAPGWLPRDTCPLRPGHDPIFNFMDYSVDLCTFRFTSGQVERMKALFKEYRTGPFAPLTYEDLTVGETIDGITLSAGESVMYRFNSTDCTLKCTTRGWRGDADLYLSMNVPIGTTVSYCSSFSPNSREECETSPVAASNTFSANLCGLFGGSNAVYSDCAGDFCIEGAENEIYVQVYAFDDIKNIRLECTDV